MGRILHVSDLHLGEPEGWQFLDDHKGDMALGDRRSQKEVLRETLEGLEADGTLAQINAVVVSGDLTNKAKPDGFAEFLALSELLKKHISAEQILVVPGNHDVPQEHGPGDPQRYAEFLRVTRDQGFATPLLDGIDFDPVPAGAPAATAPPHLVLGDDFVLIPINSSHFCWGTEPLPTGVVEEFLTAIDHDEFEALTKKMRQYDVARVSNAQMAALSELVGKLGSSDDSRVRVGVLHHQLLPISAREEFKSFESLTNLGAVRELLVNLGVRVVLHGHKHESALYWDYVSDPKNLGSIPARLLVSAAPGSFTPGSLVARVIEIGDRSRARDVGITGILGSTTRHGPLGRQPPERAHLWDDVSSPRTAEARVIRGENPSEVYARIRSVFDARDQGDPLRYLVCEIWNPSGAELVPHDYPSERPRDEVQEWMDDLVDWWQLPGPRFEDLVPFNHGDRIYRRWGDQASRAARLLTNTASGDSTTTRASILMLDPQTEASPEDNRQFPSFVSVQFQLVRDASGPRLDCTAHFRKQEMRYWWPINIAELAKIQQTVADLIVGPQRPRCGVLRTVTALAVAEEGLPIVAIPAIDRAVDQCPEDLWRMAYSLSGQVPADPTEVRATWNRYLSELRPTDARRATPMSRRGLGMILSLVKAVSHAGSEPLDVLEQLVEHYGLFKPDGAEPVAANAAVTKLLDAFEEQLDKLLPAAPSG